MVNYDFFTFLLFFTAPLANCHGTYLSKSKFLGKISVSNLDIFCTCSAEESPGRPIAQERFKRSANKIAPPMVPNASEHPSLKSGVTCSYDLVIAIDLDCVMERETPYIKMFAHQFIDDIFAQIKHIEEGYVRVGVVGFHSEVVVGMNLFVMSFEEGRRNAASKAKQAIEQLTMFSESKLNYKVQSFTEVYTQLPSLFESRSSRKRELLIITNASPGIASKSWTDLPLEELISIRRTRYESIGIRTTAIAVNQPCKTSRYYQEDCSYTSAINVIDTGFANRFIIQPDSASRAATLSTWRSFYMPFIGDINNEIEYIIDNMECTTQPPSLPPCACTSRAKVEAAVCDMHDTTPGPRGPPGPKGRWGSVGFPGMPGRSGNTGKGGPAGPPGPSGQKGAQGRGGTPGNGGRGGSRGDNGSPGLKGKPGPPGHTDVGTPGYPGRIGLPGPPGPPGPSGPPGSPGVRGDCGRPGPKGNMGMSGRNQIIVEIQNNENKLLDQFGRFCTTHNTEVDAGLTETTRRIVIEKRLCPCSAKNCVSCDGG